MSALIQNIYHSPACQSVVQFVKDHKIAIISAIGAVALGSLVANARVMCVSQYGNFEYTGLGSFHAVVDDKMFTDGFDFTNHPPFSQCTMSLYNLGNWSVRSLF
jgi:hypothetical protein